MLRCFSQPAWLAAFATGAACGKDIPHMQFYVLAWQQRAILHAWRLLAQAEAI